MSILIKEMEMPQSCNECLLSMETACGLSGKIVPDYWGRDDRPSWCELIEVPPHGRLIDADVLMAKDRQIYRLDDGAAIGIKNYIELYEIDNAPAIIEAEESKDGIS